MRLGFYFVRLSWFCLCVWAVCLISAPDARGERLPLKVYTSADGLGSSFVDTLTRDSRGFMWFATRDGLSRFDGARFVTYQVGTENSAPGVESIYETRKGVYWIVTTGGLYRFRSNALTNPSANGERPVLNAEFVSPLRGILFEDSRGNLWLSGGDLYRVVETGGQTEFEKIALNLPDVTGRSFAVIEVQEASDGCLWLKTSLGIVRKLPDDRTVFYPYEVGVLLSNVNLMIDGQDRAWLTISGNLLILKPETIAELGEFEKTKTHSLENSRRARLDAEILELPTASGEIIRYQDEGFLDDHQTKYLLQTSDDHVWMTTGEQLIEFDGRHVRRYPKIPGTSNMKRMEEDIAGNLWISGTQNLLRLNRRGITTFDENDGLRSPAVHSIQETAAGEIYIANGSAFVTEFAGGTFRTATLRLPGQSLPLWTARPALRDRRGELWVTSSNGLYRFSTFADFSTLENADPVGIYDTEKGLKAKGTYQIYEDSRGTIWVSTFTNIPSEQGLARYDRTQDRFVSLTNAEGFPEGKSASAFAEDAHGNLWVAFYQGGLGRLRDGQFQDISGIEGISSTLVSDLLFDKNGRLWIASTKSGVLRIDDPNAGDLEITRYTIETGLSSNNIRTITADPQGKIYAGTVRGVDRIAPETGRIKHFSIDDGLASDFVVDSLCDRDGNIWFATMNGVSRLNPAENENAGAPPVWIGALNVAGMPKAVGELGSLTLDDLEFPYTDNNFQIEFFALDFAPNGSLRYQYKLEGAGADWSKPTENREVNFANLAPGDYRFLVRAVNDSGAASESPAVVAFKINPPIWRTWWFLILATVLVCSALYLLYAYRTKNLRRVNQALTETQIAEEKALREREKRLAEIERVRTRIATDLHDDIGSSLTQIAVLSEVARNQAAIFKDDAISLRLQNIKEVSGELVESMSDVVWAINPNKDNLGDLVQRMRRFGSDLCAGRNTHFEFDAPPTENVLSLGANIRREVFAIFKESINNAVKYSECENIVARFWLESGTLFLEIGDDGRGFDMEELLGERFSAEKGGNGLVNMRRRAAELGGNCRIVSRIGGGTNIFLEVPLNLPDDDGSSATRSGGGNANGNSLSS
jgi:signal transduction histidine kinase/ligand-binding sensor domain-containing protein